MTSLLIDTCTEQGVIAYFSGNVLLYKGAMPKGFINSTYMMREVDEGLKKLSLTISSLKYIAVTIGPGSYTGLRIGVMAAKTLAYAGNKPLVTLCSLSGYIPGSDGDFISMIDAKIGGAYFQVGRKAENTIEWLTEPAFSRLEKIEPLQRIHRLITPNKELLEKKLKDLFPAISFEWSEQPPSAEQFIVEANAKFHAGIVETGEQFDLLYLRASPY